MKDLCTLPIFFNDPWNDLLHPGGDSQHPYFCIKLRVNQLLFASRHINQLKSLRECKYNKYNCTLMRPSMVEWFCLVISHLKSSWNIAHLLSSQIFFTREGMKDICTLPSFLNGPCKDMYPGGKSNPAALCKHGHKSAEIFKRVQKQLHADEATNGWLISTLDLIPRINLKYFPFVDQISSGHMFNLEFPWACCKPLMGASNETT